MKKDIRIVIATILLVVVMGVYKPLIEHFLPFLNGDNAVFVRKLLQALTVTAFITVLGLWRKVGSLTRISKKAIILLLPVIIFSFIPLFNGINVKNGVEFFTLLATALLIGMIEELEFRGIIFGILKQRGKRPAVLVSSITFALAHLLNLAYGAGLIETIVQVIFAFGFGLIVSVVAYETGLLLPEIIVHGLWDFTLDISNVNFNLVVDSIHSAALILVVLWGFILLAKINKTEEDKYRLQKVN